MATDIRFGVTGTSRWLALGLVLLKGVPAVG